MIGTIMIIETITPKIIGRAKGMVTNTTSTGGMSIVITDIVPQIGAWCITTTDIATMHP